MFIMGASKDSGVYDSRAVYTPPCVVKIHDLKQGAGQSICDTGSGDSLVCGSGNSAGVDGCCTGNNATTGCYGVGNSAGAGGCIPGSSGACTKD
jgi:hypothetical protein